MAEPELLKATRGPFTGGYVSSVPAFMARPEQLWGATDGSDTNSSRDCVIDPISGGVSKRAGCAIVGDTMLDGAEVNGILNRPHDFKARKFFALDSPSMTDSYPVPAILYGKDTNAGFPTTDTGFPGTIYVRSSNGSDHNYSLLEEFGTTHYAQTYSAGHTSSNFNLKVVPIWTDSGDGVYTRGALTGTSGADKFLQQFLTCGSRSLLQTQSWVYSPNLRATPWRWNKRLNESDSAGSEVVRIYPTGPFPPLFPPTATTPSSASSGTSWEDGDTYFISVLYQFEDGSYSAPFVPRAPGDILTSGLGLVTVGTVGGSNKYRFMTYSNIAIGPEGTIARVILRSNKQNRTATTDTITVNPLDLKVVGVLRNNTQTTYVDFGGDDDSLLEDNDVVRWDLVCPRRARYIGTGDQRCIITYTLPNTAAILLAPSGGSSSRQYNVADTSSLNYANGGFFVRITSTQLELHHNDGVAPDFTDTSGNAADFPFATYDTLEKLVDAINKTGVSAASGNEADEWVAQLAPGVDGSMPSSSLTWTSQAFAVTRTAANTLTGAAADIAKIGVGMELTGTGVTAGTYVSAKPSSTTLTVSTDTGALGATTTFFQETGDNGIVTGGTVGYIRAFGPNYPVLLHMKASAFPNYDKPDKTSVYYTMASPGAVVSGVSLAPNSFLAGNRSVPHSSPRQEMARVAQGIVDVDGAAIVAYTDGIYFFKNYKGGNSGEDSDCRLYTVNDGRGCVSYLGLVSGNGWAAYATPEGIMCVDKNQREFVISGDVFNASDNTGDLAYEIKTSAASAASDSDGQYLSMAVMGSKLYVAVRTDPSVNASGIPRVLSYDFSPGIEASGVEELLNPKSGSPYIWNPPAIYNAAGSNLTTIGAMGCIRNASGRLDYITYDSNAGLADGRLEQINTGTTDNPLTTGQAAQTYTGFGVVAPVIPSDFHSLTPANIEATHLTTSGTALIVLANNQVPTYNTSTDYRRVLNVDALATQFQKQVLPVALGQRGKATMLWLQWRASDANTARLWRLVVQYDEVVNDTQVPDYA